MVIIPNNSDSVNSQLLNRLEIQNNGPEISGNRREAALSSAGVGINQSWRDPQIYLQAAASGKSSPSYYDVTEFVTGNIEEEIVVGGNGSQQDILKSGPKKPKLESVTLAQWFVANLAILYRLLGEGKLEVPNILDYLSYTTKICQLVQKFNLVSVLVYDREYRKLQATHGFRWGTDIPHLHSVHLQARPVRQFGQQEGKGYTGSGNNPARSHHGPVTSEGKIICKLFNSKGPLQRLQISTSMLSAWVSAKTLSYFPCAAKKHISASASTDLSSRLTAWEEELEGDRDRHFILHGLSNDFDIIDCDSDPTRAHCPNHPSARPGSPLYEKACEQVQK